MLLEAGWPDNHVELIWLRRYLSHRPIVAGLIRIRHLVKKKLFVDIPENLTLSNDKIRLGFTIL